MSQEEPDHSSLRAKSKLGEVDVAGPGLLVLAAVCVIAIAWIAINSEGDVGFFRVFASLGLLVIAAFAIVTYQGLKLARLSTEHSTALAKYSKQHSVELAGLLASGRRKRTMDVTDAGSHSSHPERNNDTRPVEDADLSRSEGGTVDADF